MICSVVCRFRVMGLLHSAHHNTVGLPSQWCSFRVEGHLHHLTVTAAEPLRGLGVALGVSPIS